MSHIVELNNLSMEKYANEGSANWLLHHTADNDTIPKEYLEHVKAGLETNFNLIQDQLTDILADSEASFNQLNEIVSYFETRDTGLSGEIHTHLEQKYTTILADREHIHNNLIEELSGNLYTQIQGAYDNLRDDIENDRSDVLAALAAYKENFNNDWDTLYQNMSNSNRSDGSPAGLTELSGNYVFLGAGRTDMERAFTSFQKDQEDGNTPEATENKIFKLYELDRENDVYITLEEDHQHNLMYCKRVPGVESKVILQMKLPGNGEPAWVSKM